MPSPINNNNNLPSGAKSQVDMRAFMQAKLKNAHLKGNFGARFRALPPVQQRGAGPANTVNFLKWAPVSKTDYQNNTLMAATSTRLDQAAAMLLGKDMALGLGNGVRGNGVSCGNIIDDLLICVLGGIATIETEMAVQNYIQSCEAAKGKALSQAACMEQEAGDIKSSAIGQFCLSVASSAVSCVGAGFTGASNAAANTADAAKQASDKAAQLSETASKVVETAGAAANKAGDAVSQAAEKAAKAAEVAQQAAKAATKATRAADTAGKTVASLTKVTDGTGNIVKGQFDSSIKLNQAGQAVIAAEMAECKELQDLAKKSIEDLKKLLEAIAEYKKNQQKNAIEMQKAVCRA